MNIVDKPRKFYFFIVVTYGILLFLTIQILAWVLYFTFENSFKVNNDVLSQQNLSLLSFNIENLYEEAKATCEQIFIDKDVKKLRNGSRLDSVEIISVIDRLVSYSVTSSNLLSVYIYSRGANCFYSSYGSPESSTDEFFDKGVVGILRHLNEPDSNLIPRFIEKNPGSNKSGDVIKVYTLMLCEMSKNPTTVDSAVIMNFKESWISDILKDIRSDETSDYMFLNHEGLIVGGTKNDNFLSKLDNDYLLRSILQEHRKSFQYKINDLNYVITDTFSSKLSWNIVKFTAFDEVNGKIIIIRNSTLVISILVLLAAMLILLALSKNVQLPVSNVLNKLKELEIEKQGNYHSLRNTFLKKVLEEYPDPSVLAKGMEKYNVAFGIDVPLTLIILKIDKYKALCDNYDINERDSILLKLIQATGEMFSKYCRNEVVEYDKDCLVVIINSNIHQLDELKIVITQLQEYACNNHGITISCVIGNNVNDYSDIPTEFERTKELLNYRLIYGYSSVILSNDFPYQEVNKKYEYPSKKEKQLFDQLMLGKLDNALGIFNGMIEDAKYSYTSLMILFNRLVFEIYNTIEKLGGEVKLSINFDFYSFSKTINTLETLDEIVGQFKLVFETISHSLMITSNDKYSKIISMVNAFIERNYNDPNLSVNLIAGHMDKLPEYLNRIFKSSTGSSIQSCIDNIRLKKSMVLLVESSMSIKEISNTIGMANEKYFYVLFKKSMGITPSEYRKKGSTE